MESSRVFQITLLVSLAAHVAVLSQNPDFNLTARLKPRENLEIRYIKESKEKPAEAKVKPPARGQQRNIEPFLQLTQKIGAENKKPPPYIDKDRIFKKPGARSLIDSVFTKPAGVRPDLMAVKKKVTLPPIDLDKINNPSYLSYYQIVREKIRRSAYHNYTHTQTGEVYVSFVISSSGALQDTRLLEERSSQNPYLREVALRSVKDASPFPAFPKELDYPTLSFNVIISFEME